ncbi:xyloside xylosyltransferase 1-like [Dermacentor variabilis]|uniref:xyloside xylosyltransferase 1-like n=1 Tax=Dermacentor variabilis TaxID=34621 RepID=UPI003F5BF03C
MLRYTIDVAPVDRFVYASDVNGSGREVPPIHVVFLIPGCQLLAVNVTVNQLGNALDTLLQRSSRALHVDLIITSDSHSHQVIMLLECLRPRMQAGVSAVVDLYNLSSEVRYLKSLNVRKGSPRGRTGHHLKRRSLFPLCASLHRLLNVERVLLLAPQVQFYADVSLLWEQFELFPASAVFGLAREQSPRYARSLQHQRGAAPRQGGCGDPPTVGGNPGLNSAVALLDLHAMRRSPEYDRLYPTLDDMADTYGWYGGSLADSDFYTMASCRVPALLHLLPCAWNRQVPVRNKAPVASPNGVVRYGGLYSWCEGGVYACSANCPEY